jgi:hypothetical protein
MFEITTASYVCEINLLLGLNIRWHMSFLYQDTPVYPTALPALLLFIPLRLQCILHKLSFMKWNVKYRLQVPNFADSWSMVAIFVKQDVSKQLVILLYSGVGSSSFIFKRFLAFFLFLIFLAP